MSEREPHPHRWRKGMPSPNPLGRPRIEGRIRRLAQKHSRKAILRLVRLMDSENPRIAVIAANAILDRAVGKAHQAVALSGPDGEPLRLTAPVSDPLECAKIYAAVLGGSLALESVRIAPSALELPPPAPAPVESVAGNDSQRVNSCVARECEPSGLVHDDRNKVVVDIWSRLAK